MIIVLVGWCARLPLENLANSPNSSEGGGRDFLLPPKSNPLRTPSPQPTAGAEHFGIFKKNLWGGSLWTNRSTSLVSNDLQNRFTFCCYSHDIILRYGTCYISLSEYAFRSVLSCAPWMSESHECPLQRVYNSRHKHTECDEEYGEEFCYEQKFFSRFNNYNATYA